MSGVLIVTGGSRGIGAATARMAGRRGMAVAVNYNRDADAAGRVVRDIEAAGSKAIAVKADVSTAAGVAALFEATDRAFGPVTALFNNAGIVHTSIPIGGFSEADLARQWAVNITSQFLAAGEAVKRMSTKAGGRGGAIVNMSSRAAVLGGPGGVLAYAASKGAIDTFTKGLSIEVAPLGIRVNAVRPGLIDTTIHADMGDAERVTRLLPMVPAGRIGTPDEVAEAVLWLISPAASYVTGAWLDIGGGR